MWPEPTHAPADSPEVKAGVRKPWRSAAEIIDWNLPTPSIFASREEIKEQYGITAIRPLAGNTLRRVARGIDKFVIRAAEPFVMAIGQTGGGDRCRGISEPTHTQVSKAEECVVSPLISPWTVTNTTNSTGHPPEQPVDTARTGGGGGQMLVGASMIQYHTERHERVRGQSVTEPVMTIDASNRYGLAAATLTKYYSGDSGQDAAAPLHTVTTRDREGLTVASLSKFYGGIVGASVAGPLPTVTAVDHNALQTAHMIKLKGGDLGGDVREPVQTITAGGKHHGVVIMRVEKAEPGADLRYWPKIRAMLNEYCGYRFGEDEVLLFRIGGVWYFMADIGLRMLTPRELYRANGFPEDYQIERDCTGREYSKTKQVARCGNAVPPPFAAALVRANLPEWCHEEISTMAQLEEMVAV